MLTLDSFSNFRIKLHDYDCGYLFQCLLRELTNLIPV